ncbi:hypothetical protein Shyhy01_17740 [Streptomyces hygroscopicus subsp. hygroscopicus]|nr:hypothetical protein Shyhy01_17740 [Streptomyces hygroscopicus subsp. hygroscopicus]
MRRASHHAPAPSAGAMSMGEKAELGWMTNWRWMDAARGDLSSSATDEPQAVALQRHGLNGGRRPGRQNRR